MIKQYYIIIKWIMEDDNLTLEQKLKHTKEFKRDIRRICRPLKVDPFEETTHSQGHLESYYIKEFFDVPFTEEEKEEFIKEQWRHINCPWDCTGLAFTQRIEICNFKAPNSFGAMSVVYHFLGIDC